MWAEGSGRARAMRNTLSRDFHLNPSQDFSSPQRRAAEKLASRARCRTRQPSICGHGSGTNIGALSASRRIAAAMWHSRAKALRHDAGAKNVMLVALESATLLGIM